MPAAVPMTQASVSMQTSHLVSDPDGGGHGDRNIVFVLSDAEPARRNSVRFNEPVSPELVALGRNEGVATSGNAFSHDKVSGGVGTAMMGCMSEVVAHRHQVDFRPLSSDLSAEIQVWANELRVIWTAAGLSINRFAHLHNNIDKGTVSRYLNGQRVPRDKWFLEKLLEILADNGRPVAPEVAEHLACLQMRALKVAHPHEYRVRLVTDDLAIAVTAQQEAERYARFLEAQLTERIHQIHELNSDKERLRDAWTADRAAMQTEKDRLENEIGHLNRRIDQAWQRRINAEERCQRLEKLLDQVQTPRLGESHDSRLDDFYSSPIAVMHLLDGLHAAYPQAEFRAFADRVVRDVSLDDASAVVGLTDKLHRLDADDLFGTFADRVVRDVSLDDASAVVELLGKLHCLGAEAQVCVLAERAAQEVPLRDATAVVRLLVSLHASGADAQASVLAERAAKDLSLRDASAVVGLLGRLHSSGADAHAWELAERAAKDVSLVDASAVAWLLDTLRLWGADAPASVLAERAAKDVSLKDASAVVGLLGKLRSSGALFRVLADRIAKDVSLKDACAVAGLLDNLLLWGAEAQAYALAERAAKDVSLKDASGVIKVLGALRRIDAGPAAKILVDRLANYWIISRSSPLAGTETPI